MTESEKITSFLQDHPALKLDVIEKTCGVFPGTLSKALKGKRSIPKRNITALEIELKKYGYK